MSRLSRALLLLPALAALACPGTRREVAYDLARRLPVAELWSPRDVVLFGTPAAEPHQADGFYREGGGGESERFVWARQEAELSFTWPAPAARVAVADLTPYPGVKGQSARVLLNGLPVAHFGLNDSRYRYRIALPTEGQRAGENRLRFVFAGEASPAEADPNNPDRRHLAAAFHDVTIGLEGDAGLEPLLGRDAPPPFAMAERGGVPALVQVAPSVVRYAIRLPGRAELRFTPVLHPAARAAAATVRLRVTMERTPGDEREVWSGTVAARDRESPEVSVALPGRAGDIVRLGLHVAVASDDRFAWALWRAPRVLGTEVADPLQPRPPSPDDDRRGAAMRDGLRDLNVVLVILDAARARELGCYGYGRPTTPEIDRLAAEGALFERAYTPAVYTLGAMSSLWTSQQPDRHHSEVSFSARLPRDRLTLAELLSGQGIHAAGFVANAVAGAGFGFDRGFAEFHELFRDVGSQGDAFRQVLPSWLAAHKDGRFFAYLHFREPHFPYDPEPPFDTRFGPEGPIPKSARRDMRWITDLNQGRRAPRPGEIEHLIRLYDGNLAFVDQEVGRLRQALEREGLLDRTVLIVTADHGEGLFEHGWIGHNVQVYDETTRVPLIVLFPKGRGPRGMRVPGLVDLLDLAPTIADVFGALGKGGSDRAFQGRSLLPVMSGAPGKPAVLSRTVWDRPRYALFDERFKLVYDTRTGAEELYDLAADPTEKRNVAVREPLRAAYFRQALHQWIADLGRRAAAGEPATLGREQCENLRALGYLDTQCR